MNADVEIEVVARGIVISVNATQFLNALSPTLEILYGNTTDGNTSQCSKQEVGICVIPVPNLTSVRASQS